MKKLLLGIIAINLTFISANLALRSVETVQAEDQRSHELQSLIKRTVSNNCYTNHDHSMKAHAHGIRRSKVMLLMSEDEFVKIHGTQAKISCSS